MQCAGFGLVSGKSIAGFLSNRTLSFGSFPACRSTYFFKNIIKEIIKYCTNNSIAVLKMHSFATPFGTEILQELGFSVSKRWEFLVDIDMSEDELWEKLHGKKRNLIRKGQKTNLVIKKAQQIDEFMHFRNLAVATWKRKIDSGITFPSPGNEKYYQLLKDEIVDKNLGKLYLAYNGDEPVAGAFFAGYNKKVYYMLSSANEQGLKASAPDLLLWTSMTEYMKEGYEVFNLGGLSEDELEGQPLEKSGLYHFKKRFSADVPPCYKGELVLKPIAYKTYDFLSKVKNGFG
jgi:lipid II:glycine glycyltransferase (peptidoglycan interpeptide bridge formation enzyme)